MENQPMQGKKSNKTLLVVVGVIVVIGAAVGIYFTTQGEDENTNADTVATTNAAIDAITDTASPNTNTAPVNLNTSTTANTNTTELSGSERREFIKEVVEAATSDMTFPTDLDPVTRVTGIVATSTAIQYQFSLHDIDESLLSDEILKNNTMPSLCQTAETRIEILNRGIDMEYSYQVENSTQTYFFSVSKDDCI